MRMTSAEWEAEGVREDREIKGLLYLSVAAQVAAGVWSIVICSLRKRIVLAIACVREASRAISKMPVITLYPVVQVLGLFLFTLPWGVYMAYLASSGEIEAQCICPMDYSRRLEGDSANCTDLYDSNNVTGGLLFNNCAANHTLEGESNQTALIQDNFECDDGCYVYKSFSYSRNTQYAGLFMMFVWFWTSQFIVAIGQLVTAMSVSMWYFTREKASVGNWTFFRAMGITMIYHLGTCAFGSLIIAIIKTIRAIIQHVQSKAAKMNNKIAVILLQVLQCCMWCIEKCMKFINKNGKIENIGIGSISFKL